MTLPRLLLLVFLLFACTVLGVGVVALSEREETALSQEVPTSRPVADGPVGGAARVGSAPGGGLGIR